MLKPDFLEKIPLKLVGLFKKLEEWTVSSIVKRIKSSVGSVITSSAEMQMTSLVEMTIFENDLKKEIQRTLKLTDNEIEKLYKDASEANYIHDKRLFNGVGVKTRLPDEGAFTQNLINNLTVQTKGDLYNITKSMGFAEMVNGKMQFKPIADFYQTTLDDAMMKITTGVADYNTAIKQAVDAMVNSGLRTVDYATGWHNRVEVAVRRAIMSGMRDLANNQSRENAKVLGTTIFELTWHGGHRPSHGWGGRRFDTTGKLYPTEQELYAKYGGGTPEDYNCYHSLYAVDPSMPPNYTDEELKVLEAKELETKTYNGKEYNAYEARQQQRKIETAMRRTRLKIKGYKEAGIEEDAVNEKIKYNRQRQIYNDFSKQMNLRTEYERVYVDGLGRQM